MDGFGPFQISDRVCGNESYEYDEICIEISIGFKTLHHDGFYKSPKACESGRFSAEYDNLRFNPDTKSRIKILWDFA
jgi:hypothetical protein